MEVSNSDELLLFGLLSVIEMCSTVRTDVFAEALGRIVWKEISKELTEHSDRMLSK